MIRSARAIDSTPIAGRKPSPRRLTDEPSPGGPDRNAIHARSSIPRPSSVLSSRPGPTGAPGGTRAFTITVHNSPGAPRAGNTTRLGIRYGDGKAIPFPPRPTKRSSAERRPGPEITPGQRSNQNDQLGHMRKQTGPAHQPKPKAHGQPRPTGAGKKMIQFHLIGIRYVATIFNLRARSNCLATPPALARRNRNRHRYRQTRT